MKDSPSYLKSFAAGLDPSGTLTFNLAKKEKDKSRRTIHKGVGTVSGLIGGATLLPSVVMGGLAVGNNKSHIGAQRGVKGKALAALKLFAEGAISPYRQLYVAARATRNAGKMKAGSSLNKAAIKDLDYLLDGKIKQTKSHIRKKNPLAHGMISTIKAPLKQEHINTLHQELRSKTLSNSVLLGSSAAVGGASSWMQFDQGSEVGDQMRSLQNKHNKEAGMNIIQANLEKVAQAAYDKKMEKVAGRSLKFITQAIKKRNLVGTTPIRFLGGAAIKHELSLGTPLKDVLKSKHIMPKTNASQAITRLQAIKNALNDFKNGSTTVEIAR